jgi:hypothetical protein
VLACPFAFISLSYLHELQFLEAQLEQELDVFACVEALPLPEITANPDELLNPG